jgi:hypothetical protein
MLESLDIFDMFLISVGAFVVVDVIVSVLRLEPPPFEEEDYDCGVETHEPEDYE